MARAFVELVGSASYTVNKRKFVRNAPQVLTDPDEILFFQNRPGFKVSIQKDAKKEATEKKKVDVKKLDQELKTIVEKPKKEEKKKEEKEEKVEAATHTKESLLSLKKVELSALAEEMGIVFDAPMKRLKMIEVILQKQEG